MLLQFFVTLENLVADRVQASKDRGATAVEYGLMVGLIAVFLIASVTALGGNIATLFNRISTALNGVAN